MTIPAINTNSAAIVPELPAEFFDRLEDIGIACRLVAGGGRVIWQSVALCRMLEQADTNTCCGDLGARHTDPDCISRRTMEERRPRHIVRWLGRRYVAIDALPVRRAGEPAVISFEVFRDCTVEKTLESALSRQQELLESVNRSMIEINHDLEAVQVELREKNDGLAAANEQLRSLDRLKDEFIGIVSHELKAPLTSIRGSVQLIQSCDGAKLSPTGSELLAVCQRNIERLQRLIIDLLDITRIESGRLSLNVSHFDALSAIEECVFALNPLAERKHLMLHVDAPADLSIEADRDRLIQVLINLVNNAIKFTDHGSVTIKAGATESGIQLEVRDTGIGIPHDDFERIFEKFAQVGSALQRNAEGTGLGLSIARSVIREHGGDIVVDSVVGEGSRFIAKIPQPPRSPR